MIEKIKSPTRAMSINTSKNNSMFTGIDAAKFLFAILVIGIHTEPFGFNLWADRMFGIMTRLCVPFFFVTSAFFLYRNGSSIKQYIMRILRLYFVWSLIYLPFSLHSLHENEITDTLRLFFWYGNNFALWYLWGTVIATVVVTVLIKLFKRNAYGVLITSLVLFLVGLLGSTWNPMIAQTTGGGFGKNNTSAGSKKRPVLCNDFC